MKKLLTAIIISLLFNADFYSQSPTVHSIIDQTNIDSLILFVEELSGEIPTIIAGQPYTIFSRHKEQPGNDKAADYIQQKLEYYGLTVYNQIFDSTGRNVYAVQTGTDFPNQQYIICAHYDDLPPGPVAPGADDNASGVAAVIEAARIMSNYSFPYTFIYALWDEKEQGLYNSGSDYFADQAASLGDSILGVINLDMIAWDSDNNSIAEIHTKILNNSRDIKNKMIDVNTAYYIGLNIEVIDPGLDISDHSNFWDVGYSAIMLMEDRQDINAYYHSINDKVQHFNHSYYHKMCKLAIGSLATLALGLDLRVLHTPIASRDNTNDILTTAEIFSDLAIGTGQRAPRLYYRVNQGAGWSEFYDVVGTPIGGNVTYSFTIPGQTLGTIVQYYLAAQDEDSSIVITVPAGGTGFSPPGNIPPEEFYKFYVANTTIAFTDSTMNMDNWASVGGWYFSTAKYTSYPYSFTDSPPGNYHNLSTAILTYNGFISLEGYLGALLEFQTQWDIEDDWDYAQVQVLLNNGGSWVPLEGLHTNPGSGLSNFQPYGQPLYDGTQLEWVKESMDISDYVGEEIKIRFLLETDWAVEADGIYVDDINLIVYEAVPISAEQDPNYIFEYKLEQSYPNPFNPSTTIQYSINERSSVELILYDILGRQVEVLVNEEQDAGHYKINFNAGRLASGIYLYKLQAGDFVETKKMVLMK